MITEHSDIPEQWHLALRVIWLADIYERGLQLMFLVDNIMLSTRWLKSFFIFYETQPCAPMHDVL